VFSHCLERFATLSSLYVPLLDLQFNLFHGGLKTSPFFRSHRLKLKAELPPLASPKYASCRRSAGSRRSWRMMPLV
jgi:hypothetical protein